MRTIKLNEFVDLKENEIDNGNKVFKYNFVNSERHAFKIASIESFNLCRKNQYFNDNVIDGDIICHKNWFKFDKLLEKGYENGIDIPMKITWDHRFYVVVKGYDGKAYAVNIKPRFYGDLVDKATAQGINENGEFEQFVVPIEELSDDYVFALSDSFIMDRFSSCSGGVIKDAPGVVNRDLTSIYTIEEENLVALRFIAYIKMLKNKGVNKIVVSFSGTKYLKERFKSDLLQVKGLDINLNFSFLGVYLEKNADVVICRPEIANKYEKNGYCLIDFDDLVNRQYEPSHNYERIRV